MSAVLRESQLRCSPDWQRYALGDLCRIELGSTPARESLQNWDSARSTDNVWLSIADMPSDLHAVVSDSREYVSDDAAKRMRVVPEGTLLVSFKLTLGRLCYAGRDLFTNEAIAALHDIDSSRVCKEFLYWCLTYFDWHAAAASDHKIKGKTLNKAKLKMLPLALPSLEEQKRIVAVLDQAFAALDRARANAEANLADSIEIFDAALHTIFHKDLAKASKRLLPDVCTHFGRGKSKHRPRNDPELYGGDVPFIQTGDISNATHLIESYGQTYSEKGLAQSMLWPKGTICIAIVGATIGETGILGFDACFPDSVIGLRPDPHMCDPRYVEFMLHAFKGELKDAGKGSARDNINLATFQNKSFPFPALKQQTAIVEQLDGLARETASLRANYKRALNDLAALRQSLLQKAFAGELA